MKAQDYVNDVLVVENREFDAVVARLNDNRNLRILHAQAGVSSEISELIELVHKFRGLRGEALDRVNLMEECGDILWYVAVASHALNCVDKTMQTKDYSFTGLNAINDDKALVDHIMNAVEYLAKDAGNFADLTVKKVCFYGKPFNDEPMIALLASIHNQVEVMLNIAGYTVEDARDRNMTKLKKRYGNKFSEAAALNRDLDAERAILEGKND